MTKRKHRALMWVGAILGVMIVATVIFVATLDWNKAKKYIVAGVSKATGRQLKINGDLNVDLGWISTSACEPDPIRERALEHASSDAPSWPR